MQEQEQHREMEKEPTTAAPKTVSLQFEKQIILFGVMLLGLLLIIIGLNVETDEVYYAGAFILPAALLWAGLFLKEESSGMRITLLAVGGYLIASLLSGVSSIISRLFGG
jgi:hypothetical protein